MKLNDLFIQPTEKVAKLLLGMHIIRKMPGKTLIGKIVETEAYLSNDPASHAYKGKTKRNEAMFGRPGTAYVYFIYGAHYCLNVVTREEGVGEAVLIRAIQPIKGISFIKNKRKQDNIQKICNGPGKLCDAFYINKEFNGTDLLNNKGKLYIEIPNIGTPIKASNISKTVRIGINRGQKRLLRFYIKDSPFVSALKK